MKTLVFSSAFLMLFAISLFAQTSKTITFKVTGNCEMCEKTIEGSLKNEKGISKADWNKASKLMTVQFNPELISESEIHKKIAASGYDTEKEKASDKIYGSLPACCQYKRTLHQGH